MATRRSDQGLREDQGRLFAGRKGRQVKRGAEPFEGEGKPSLFSTCLVGLVGIDRTSRRTRSRPRGGGRRTLRAGSTLRWRTYRGKRTAVSLANLIGASEKASTHMAEAPASRSRFLVRPKRTIDRIQATPVTTRARSELMSIRMVAAREVLKTPIKPKRAARAERPAPIGTRMRDFVNPGITPLYFASSKVEIL